MVSEKLANVSSRLASVVEQMTISCGGIVTTDSGGTSKNCYSRGVVHDSI